MTQRSAVSVVVPTRDRPEQLRACLDALARQTYGPIEVVVVDDGSVAAEAVRNVVDAHPSMTLIRAEGRGPAAARNAGVAASSGALACFTDDDCLADPEWVARLVAALSDAADVVSGTVDNGRPDDPYAEAWHAIVDCLSEAGRRAGGVFVTSNNLACRIEVARAIPFDEAYELAAGEDRDWAARVVAAGYRVVTERRALVVHRQALGPRAFLRQHFRYGAAAHAFRGGRGLERPGFYANLLRCGFSRGARVGLLVGVAQVVTAAGYALASARSRRPS